MMDELEPQNCADAAPWLPPPHLLTVDAAAVAASSAADDPPLQMDAGDADDEGGEPAPLSADDALNLVSTFEHMQRDNRNTTTEVCGWSFRYVQRPPGRGGTKGDMYVQPPGDGAVIRSLVGLKRRLGMAPPPSESRVRPDVIGTKKASVPGALCEQALGGTVGCDLPAYHAGVGTQCRVQQLAPLRPRICVAVPPAVVVEENSAVAAAAPAPPPPAVEVRRRDPGPTRDVGRSGRSCATRTRRTMGLPHLRRRRRARRRRRRLRLSCQSPALSAGSKIRCSVLTVPRRHRRRHPRRRPRRRPRRWQRRWQRR